MLRFQSFSSSSAMLTTLLSPSTSNASYISSIRQTCSSRISFYDLPNQNCSLPSMTSNLPFRCWLVVVQNHDGCCKSSAIEEIRANPRHIRRDLPQATSFAFYLQHPSCIMHLVVKQRPYGRLFIGQSCVRSRHSLRSSLVAFCTLRPQRSLFHCSWPNSSERTVDWR